MIALLMGMTILVQKQTSYVRTIIQTLKTKKQKVVILISFNKYMLIIQVFLLKFYYKSVDVPGCLQVNNSILSL